MRALRNNIHKVLCGLTIAAAFVILPLPALADTATEQPQSASPLASDTTSTPVVIDTPAVSLVDSTTIAAAAPVLSLPVQDTSTTSNTIAATVQVGNTVDSTATSGNADVTDNHTGGNATTGGASATATVVNVANSTGVTTGNFQTFTCDIHDDLQQNIVIDPTSLMPMCDNTGAPTSTSSPAGSPQALQTGASLVDILNNIVLSASSGNATVADNGTAGNATTGDATALANILNIANTAIGAQNSFLGVINIYGSLKGNILVPQSLVDSLISNNDAAGNGGVTTTTINNTINASASSGNATVADNGTAGNATTGDAMTNVMVLNLTGQEVVAKNSLLVFVNVLGKWMGMIVPAPGSNTALLGGGVTTSSTGAAGQGASDSSTTNITNNISVQAQTGDAAVTDNHTAGNATSGNAKAGINLVNITNSNFMLQDWFGALFINVLGSWMGDFDIQASAPATPTDSTPEESTQPIQDVQVYEITEPLQVTPDSESSGISNYKTASVTTDNGSTGTVLGTSTTPIQDDSQVTHSIKVDFVALAAMIAALTLLFALATATIRRRFAANRA